MTANHTPGSWQINHRAPDQICDADVEVRGCAPIATMCGSLSERKANAALIVRAPEMAAEIARLQAQVDALAGALERMLSACPDANDGRLGISIRITHHIIDACRNSRAALAAFGR